MGKECYSEDINYVDFNDIAIKARDMAEIANEAKIEVLNAYEKMKDLGKNWSGNAYRRFIELANKYIEPLDECFEICTMEIPVNLIDKANQYCRRNLDVGSLTWEFPRINYRPFVEIPVTNNETGTRIKSEPIRNDMNDISNCFNNAKRKLDDSNNVAQSINWDSGSGTINKQHLESEFNKIKEILSEIAGCLSTSAEGVITYFEKLDQEMAVVDVNISEDDIAEANSAADELLAEIQANSSATWEAASAESTGGIETNISGDDIYSTDSVPSEPISEIDDSAPATWETASGLEN